MLGDIVNAAVNLIHSIGNFFHDIAPGGFGLILVPLIILGLITLWAVRKDQYRG